LLSFWRIAACALLAAALPLAGQKLSRLEKVETKHAAGRTRLTLTLSGPVDIQHERIENPARVFVDFAGTVPAFPGKGPHVFPVQDPIIRQVRVAQNQKGLTRVVLDLLREDVEYQTIADGPNRLFVDLKVPVGKARNPLANPSLVSQIAAKPSSIPQFNAPTRSFRSTYRLPAPPEIASSWALPKADTRAMPYLATGFVFRDLRAAPPLRANSPKTAISRQAALAGSATAATTTSAGKSSLTRVLGLKIGRVVIDPGHGGHDAGSSGPSGLTEKEITLDVALRLSRLLEDDLGAEVVLTRADDRYVSLEDRGAIANRSRADLFISIHANASRHSAATGVETYYLNFTSSPEALEVAARENAVSERSVNDLGDLIKKIALKDKLDESREFAGKVQAALYQGAGRAGNRTKDRGVRKAPFVVLIGAGMPSILTEIGFLSNAREEALLKKPEYRQKIAESLFRGIEKYAGTLSHFNVAQRSSGASDPEE
jgi:N-acetylmuramoyl-L-alanine amidase